jgi:predicted SnoaL-like aldol condensation-catalyzing enzyme
MARPVPAAGRAGGVVPARRVAQNRAFRHLDTTMIKTVSAAVLAIATLMAPHAATAGTAQEEANRKTVLEFYDKGLNQKDADAAIKYMGNRYVQHNPGAADGPEGFRRFIGFLRDKFPQSKSEIKRSFVEGDYVILHVHAVRVPGERGNAIIDIFKLENGKIVEHWDVVQPIPEKPANDNGMF